MSMIVKCLKNGPVTTTTNGELYKAPDGTQKCCAIVKTMRFVNTSTTSALTLDLWIWRRETSVRTRIGEVAKSIPAKGLLVDTAELTLDWGDKVEGTGSAAGIEFTLSGLESEASA